MDELLEKGLYITVVHKQCSLTSLYYGMQNRTLMLIFWYQKIIFWYQKLISDIRKCQNHFLISENVMIFWYQKLFSDIRKFFFISENATIFWYQKLFSDIRKSKFPLVFAKMNRYFIMFVVRESKLGHDPVITSSQEYVMKCTAPEYSCKLHKVETCHLKFKIHLCKLLVWKFSAVNAETMWWVCEMFTCVQMWCLPLVFLC